MTKAALFILSPTLGAIVLAGYAVVQITPGITVSVADFVALGVGASAFPSAVLWAIWRKWAATDKKEEQLLKGQADMRERLTKVETMCGPCELRSNQLETKLHDWMNEQGDRLQVAITAHETKTADAIQGLTARLERHIDRNGGGR